MGDVIEWIIARDHLERPVSPPPLTPLPPPLQAQQRAEPSGLNIHLPLFRRRVYLSDEEDLERPVWPPIRRAH